MTPTELIARDKPVQEALAAKLKEVGYLYPQYFPTTQHLAYHYTIEDYETISATIENGYLTVRLIVKEANVKPKGKNFGICFKLGELILERKSVHGN